MNLKKIAAALSMAGATVFSGAAFADPSITNIDGTNTPFGGFDWASASVAWTSGFQFGNVGSSFNLNYVGWAVSVTDLDGQPFQLPNLDIKADGTKFTPNAYEYTIVANFSEKITGCTADFSSCTFQVTGGTFDIYYDTAADAKAVKNGAWTGFSGGTSVNIISGNFLGGSTTTFNTATGGQADLTGFVTYTNSAYINPALVSTAVSSTLQLAKTNFATPTSVDGNAVGAGQIVFQADANQTFSTVPEPASLALVGLALGGLGFVARRRK